MDALTPLYKSMKELSAVYNVTVSIFFISTDPDGQADFNHRKTCQTKNIPRAA